MALSPRQWVERDKPPLVWLQVVAKNPEAIWDTQDTGGRAKQGTHPPLNIRLPIIGYLIAPALA